MAATMLVALIMCATAIYGSSIRQPEPTSKSNNAEMLLEQIQRLEQERLSKTVADSCLDQGNTDELAHAVVLTIIGDAGGYENLHLNLNSVIKDKVDAVCRQPAYFSLCCPGETYNGPYPGTITSPNHIQIAAGYPKVLEGTSMYEVALFASPRPDNHLCAASTGSDYYIPQSVLFDALEPEKFTITVQMMGCCFGTWPAEDWLSLPEVEAL